ncbi:hypothetical protein SUDANB66_00125 [Streptomyces sp. SudanB66_2053]
MTEPAGSGARAEDGRRATVMRAVVSAAPARAGFRIAVTVEDVHAPQSH